MCMSSPSAPPTPDPIVIAPEQAKKLELNPQAQKGTTKKSKKLGTKKLQIPMGGTTGKAGLSIPKS